MFGCNGRRVGQLCLGKQHRIILFDFLILRQRLNFQELNRQFSSVPPRFLRNGSCQSKTCFWPSLNNTFAPVAKPSRNQFTRFSFDSKLNTSSHHESGNGLTRNSIVVKVKDLERYLRIRGYSTLKWGFGILATLGFAIYMFREPIKENISDEVADVASRSLGDENVVLRANEISKAIVNQVLTDKATVELASGFVTNLLQSEELMERSVVFVKAVINDEETQKTIKKLAEGTLQSLLEQEYTRELLLDYVRRILLDNYTRDACKKLLDELAADRQTKQILADFFKRVLQSDTVTNEAVSLGKNVTKQIVTDKNIQEETGVALWMAVKKTLTPSWLFAPDIQTPKPQDLGHKKFETGPF